jgi:hypothetical protein
MARLTLSGRITTRPPSGALSRAVLTASVEDGAVAGGGGHFLKTVDNPLGGITTGTATGIVVFLNDHLVEDLPCQFA